MKNILVSLKELLAPGRSEFEQTKLMTVLSVSKQGEKYRHNLSGDNSKMVKLLDYQYETGNRLIVSDGEVIGKAKKSEPIFFV